MSKPTPDLHRVAIGYARVSTEEQAAEGVSIEAQVAKIRAYAELHELDLLDVIRDPGASARTLDRPGLSRVLTIFHKAKAGVLVVAKLDRLTRSLADWQFLIDHTFDTVRLCSVAESIDTASAGGRLVLNLLVSVAQWEREANQERTRDALRHKRARGERTGTVPYGFRLGDDGSTLVVAHDEVATLALLRDLVAQGVSVRARIPVLEAMGFRPRSGGDWTPGAVSHLSKLATSGPLTLTPGVPTR